MIMAARRPALDGPSTSSTTRPKTWGEVLKEHREAAGLTQTELADRVITHQTTISHLESGRTVPTEQWARRLDEALGSGGHLLTAFELVSPYLSAPHPNWDWFEDFTKAEAQARRIYELQTGRISGLLQTETYMRALFVASNPLETEELIDDRVRARRDRQARLFTADAPLLVSILDEATLRRVVGSRAAMRDQLEHLLFMGGRSNVIIQVIPFGEGESTHMPMSGMVTLELPNGQRSIYSESLSRGHFMEDAGQVSRYLADYDRSRAQALSQTESAELIQRVLKGLDDHDPTPEPLRRDLDEEQPLRWQQRQLHRVGPRVHIPRRRPRP